MRRHRIGLALSGGGVRGFAHVGILKGLEARGWKPDLITGASMGGIVAAAYASGMSVAEMESESLTLTSLRHLANLLDRKIATDALIAGDRLLRYFEAKLPSATFDELKIPLGLMAVDCLTGEQVHLTEGNLSLAVRATMAFPGIFAPVEMQSWILVDGGASDNLPIGLARDLGAERVIAVDVCPRGGSCPVAGEDDGTSLLPAPRLMSMIQKGLDLVVAALTDLRLERCPPDVLLRPAIPQHVGTFAGFTHISECIASGELEVSTRADELKAIFEG